MTRKRIRYCPKTLSSRLYGHKNISLLTSEDNFTGPLQNYLAPECPEEISFRVKSFISRTNY